MFFVLSCEWLHKELYNFRNFVRRYTLGIYCPSSFILHYFVYKVTQREEYVPAYRASRWIYVCTQPSQKPYALKQRQYNKGSHKPDHKAMRERKRPIEKGKTERRNKERSIRYQSIKHRKSQQLACEPLIVTNYKIIK